MKTQDEILAIIDGYIELYDSNAPIDTGVRMSLHDLKQDIIVNTSNSGELKQESN